MKVKKEYLLFFGSTSITLLVALAILNWQAPHLLGLPSDLQLVQIDKAVSPFYTGVFRWDELQSSEFILPDPLTRVRARPFHPETLYAGPHDVLGFRNRAVPSIIDVVVIGDSQTYGNNAVLEQNWPSQMRSLLKGDQNGVYSMATGGWAAVQYLDMFSNATVFRPKVAVVAFYSGNDPVESFQMVYGNPSWNGLLPDAELKKGDIPRAKFPAPESEWWRVEFSDGIKTIFTPTLRLASNLDHPAIAAGYLIMADVARRISEIAKTQEIQVVFTVIPTKELVYAEKVKNDGLVSPEDYTQLVASERSYIEYLGNEIQAIPGAVYVDMIGPMQKAALAGSKLYPEGINGHPVAVGYQVIAKAVADKIAGFLGSIPHGLYGVLGDKNQANIALVNDKGGWFFSSMDLIEKNGWPEGKVATMSARDFAGLTFMGVINQVDRTRFGPKQ